MRGRHVGRVPGLALALLAPVRQQVALEHVRELELTRRGLLEPLLGAGMGLDLGHDARDGFMPQFGPERKGFDASPRTSPFRFRFPAPYSKREPRTGT